MRRRGRILYRYIYIEVCEGDERTRYVKKKKSRINVLGDEIIIIIIILGRR